MIIRKEKGAANLMAYFLYIFVSIVVLSAIVYGVQKTIQDNEEKYQFDEMIKNILLVSTTIESTAEGRFSSREISIFNPDVLEVDCNQNQIRGEITYNLEFREDQLVVINDIEITKKTNRLYFVKELNDGGKISCRETSLNKGKTKYIFRYQEYDVENGKIILSIELPDFNRSEN